MDARSQRILDRLQALTQFCKQLQWRNTELRLEQIQLSTELERTRRDAETLKLAAIQWESESANWQQVAIAAIAKADQAERNSAYWKQIALADVARAED